MSTNDKWNVKLEELTTEEKIELVNAVLESLAQDFTVPGQPSPIANRLYNLAKEVEDATE